ncbi:hypothetical protein L6164_023603 [Bauhinia variegata]|uniref:Uncharacterized protein n=1 Tax=Bauhinia variegata TaxID=167791 RepID=A0ACB9MNS7_BAUVA|nr:hypothetical protein L6164_023603 [Bauhinia variegata]
MFSTRTTYHLHKYYLSSYFSHLWRIKCHTRVKQFLWRCAYNSLPVAHALAHRNILDNEDCKRCRSGETVLHCLRDCDSSKSIWKDLGSHEDFFNLSLTEWLSASMKNNEAASFGVPWSTILAYGCWVSWGNRNNLWFRNTLNNIKPSNRIKAAAVEFFHLGKNSRDYPQRLSKLVYWLPTLPPQGWYKLNCDASAVCNPVVIGFGGVIRNPQVVGLEVTVVAWVKRQLA